MPRSPDKALSVNQILDWAAHHRRKTGKWPSRLSGEVLASPGEYWNYVDRSLVYGYRGLAGGTTLKRLLSKKCGYPIRIPVKSILTEKQILAWADAHKRRTGKWPKAKSGPIPNSKGENWNAVSFALFAGWRGLPPGGSLTRLLKTHRNAPDRSNLSLLRVDEILAWADQHHARTGKWPNSESGTVHGCPHLTWKTVVKAMSRGNRRVARGLSLRRLLVKERGIPQRYPYRPLLSEKMILRWADEHKGRTGRWPTQHSGPVANSDGENWSTINNTLMIGGRGLSPGGSLARLLKTHRGRRNHRDLQPLTPELIVEWAKAHHKRTGRWPTSNSGPIPEAPGEKWMNVERALRSSGRGLGRRNLSIARVLSQHVGKRNRLAVPKLTPAKILQWADEHHERTGRWPRKYDGVIPNSAGETWNGVITACHYGQRGLSGDWTLDDLLVEKRGKRSHLKRPDLNVTQIRKWAREHFDRMGKWPGHDSGEIPGSDGETWKAVAHALSLTTRGITQKTTLGQLTQDLRRTYEWPARRIISIRSSADEEQRRPYTPARPRRTSAPARSTAPGRARGTYEGPPLKLADIILWARAYHRRHGEWPERYSGRIPDARGETWLKVDEALRKGQRGLTKRTTLLELVRNLPTPRRII